MSSALSLTSNYPLVFLFNWLVEIAVLLAILSPRPLTRLLWVSAILNLATHPLLWFGLLHLPGAYLTKLFVAELAVAVAEFFLGLRLLRGYASSAKITVAILAANALTFALTFLI